MVPNNGQIMARVKGRIKAKATAGGKTIGAHPTETQEGDPGETGEVTITTGKGKTITTKAIHFMGRDTMNTEVDVTEIEISDTTDEIGMGIDIRMTDETTEVQKRTNSQTSKFCPGWQNSWTNLSQKTCRGVLPM